MNDNVVPFGVIKPNNSASTETGDKFPENNYVITDIDHEDFYARGFLIFTPHHCAIMTDFGNGAVPVLVVPLHRVVVAEMATDDEDEQVA